MTAGHSERGALVFSSCWVGVGVLALNAPMVDAGWWSYSSNTPTVLDMSIPLLIGWVLVWGVIAPLLGMRTIPTVALLAGLDLLAMPRLSPLVELNDGWLIGEIIFLVFVATPAVAIARSQAIRADKTVTARLLAQATLFVVGLCWVTPGVARGELGLPAVPPMLYGVVVGMVGAALLPGAIAVVEFGLHRGTPWPWDRTVRPIRSGPFRYLRSPMQASGSATVLALAAIYQAWQLVVAALVALAWSARFSQTERTHLADRWGHQWTDLAFGVRRWIPRWRPDPAGESAVLWADFGCDVCTSSTRVFLNREAANLELCDARTHPEALTRIRYERADGVVFDGIAAYGAALEHVNLAAAMLGWFIRFPGVTAVVQLFADASGLGPRPVSQLPDAATSRL